jgi:hypothetical protein
MPVVDAERKIPRRPRSGAAPITLILHTSVRLAVHAARPRISRICRLACTSDPAAPDQSKQGAATNRAKKKKTVHAPGFALRRTMEARPGDGEPTDHQVAKKKTKTKPRPHLAAACRAGRAAPCARARACNARGNGNDGNGREPRGRRNWVGWARARVTPGGSECA